MSNATRLSDDDELLVAYLDGELDPGDRHQLETRLADDELLRHRLYRLQQAWDALDELPRAEPSAAFTASTVSMAAVMAKESQPTTDAVTSAGFHWPPLRRTGWVAALLLLGVLVVLIPRRWHYARELRDLPVAFNLDRYNDVQSLAFLERLDREDLFVDASAPVVELPEDPPAAENPTVSTAVRLVTARHRDEIKAALESLNPDQRLQLVELYERFDRLSPSEKSKLRSFHHDLSHHPDADRLTRVLTSFHAWMATLESSQRADIQDLGDPERIDEIRKTLLSQLAESPDSVWMDLTPRHLESIRKWLLDYVRQHQAEIVELLPPLQQSRLRQHAGVPAAEWMIGAVAWRLPDVASQLPRPTDEEIARLLRGLPENAERRLAEQVKQEGVAPLFELAARVLRAVRQIPRFGRRDRLDEVLNSLPPAERQRLLGLGPEELMRELRRHAEQQRDAREPFGPRRDRRGPPPPWDRPDVGPPPR